jgi:glycosyltransferase involved in cell wall biosynthesis
VSDCDYSVEHLRGLVDSDTGARIHRLVLGVDGDRFSRNGAHPAGPMVVAVARLVEKKGLAYLVEATALLARGGTDVRVEVVGEGPLRGELEALVRTSGVENRVALLGERTPDQVHALLERAALLAMPCVVARDGDRDTMPVVVKEALAMEVPVVATQEVGLPEVVHDGWGRLVAPRDPRALAAAIGDLLALPPERRAAMGRAGREFVLAECNLTRETERLMRLVEGAARR